MTDGSPQVRTGAEALVASLERAGVEVVFGVSGHTADGYL